MAKRALDTRDDIRVVTSNNFLRATGLENISLRARKLLYIALAQSRFNDKKLFEYTISTKDFAKLVGARVNHIYEEADSITDELMQGFVKYRPFGKREFVKHQLFKTCRYANGDLTFELSEEMTPIVLNLRRDFTMPLLQDFLQMRSNYSIEIWHLIQPYLGKDRPSPQDPPIEWEISLSELREWTGTKDKFAQVGQFKARVLDPALREIEERCGFRITYGNVKEGKLVTGFRFSCENVLRDRYLAASRSRTFCARMRKAELVSAGKRGRTNEEEQELEALREELYGK